jgi:hypothetical protein
MACHNCSRVHSSAVAHEKESGDTHIQRLGAYCSAKYTVNEAGQL